MDISRISHIKKLFRKKKGLDLRPQSVYDLQKFRDLYLTAAGKHRTPVPPCLDQIIYKAISSQKNITTLDFRNQAISDDQLFALVETLLELPLVSTLDLRDNDVTDKGISGVLELMRHQLVLAKGSSTSPKSSSDNSIPEHTRFLTSVQLKGNDISDPLLQQLRQYSSVLLREDKRLEIHAVLNQIDYNHEGGIDENELRVALKLCGGDDPTKRELQYFSEQLSSMTWQIEGSAHDHSNARACLENLLLAKYAKSPSKKDTSGMPPMDSLVQIRHADLVKPSADPVPPSPPKQEEERPVLEIVNASAVASPEPSPAKEDSSSPAKMSSAEPSPTSRCSSLNVMALRLQENASPEKPALTKSNSVMIMTSPLEDDRPCIPFEEPRADTDDEIEDPSTGEETCQYPPSIDEAAESPVEANEESFNLSPTKSELMGEEPEDADEDGEEGEEVEEQDAPIDPMSHSDTLVEPEELPTAVVLEPIAPVCLSNNVMLLQDSRSVAKLQHEQLRMGPPLGQLFDSIYFETVVALILSDNQLESVAFLEQMEPMRALRVLDLSNNSLTRLSGAELMKIRNVEVLDLSRNNFKSICGIGHLTKLRALSYEGNKIRCAKNLETLERLEILNISHNAIMVPQSLRLLSMNTNLTHLNIDENPIVMQDKHRKNSAHILNIIPTLRSLGCIHLAALIIKDKKQKKTGEEEPNKSIFEFLNPPRPWVDYACELLSIVCDPPNDAPPSPVPKVSRTQQKSKDDQRSKALPHHVVRKAPPATPPPAPVLPKPAMSRSSQQKKAVELSTPRPNQTVCKGPSSILCHPPGVHPVRPAPIVEHKSVTVSRVPPTKGFLQPTRASIYAHAEQKREREKAKKKKAKPANAMYKRLKRREDQLRQVVAASPVKLILSETSVQFPAEPPAVTLPTPIPTATSWPASAKTPALELSPVKPGSLAITSTDSFLAQIRLNEFITLVTEDHATASEALDILVGMCEKSGGDMAKFTSYKMNLDSLHIFADIEINPATHSVLELAKQQQSPAEPLPVLRSLDELKTIKTALKTLVEYVEGKRLQLGSSDLRGLCATIRTGPLKHLFSPVPAVSMPYAQTQPPPAIDTPFQAIMAATSLDLLSPMNVQIPSPAPSTAAEGDDLDHLPTSTSSMLDEDDPFDLEATDDAFSAEVAMETASEEPMTSFEPPTPQAHAANDSTSESVEFDATDDIDFDFESEATLEVEVTAEPTKASQPSPVLEEEETTAATVATAASPAGSAAASPVVSPATSPAPSPSKDDQDVEFEADQEDENDAEEETADEDIAASGGEEEEEDDEALTFGDWEQGFDSSTNHHYWFNNVTEESQWTPPDGWPHPVEGAEDASDDGEVAEAQEEEEEDEGDRGTPAAPVEEEVELSLEDRIATALQGGSSAKEGKDNDDDGGGAADDFDFDDYSLPDL
ncbi:Aste57867_1953 [Aphanomyces stellatus]|uniref:Aste57867_1953 protein n=1 Tax=Aphanomyces stellatus TaxID=120398 RepID=A0A485KBK7_9STRA|nr:hypothetical protein As57867_001951 [Aphanomyces stellatus]VFT79158.1 Aste57867_1953 [Aphanomyces stellatus]